MTLRWLTLLVLIPAAALSLSAPAGAHILNLANGKYVSLEEMIRDLHQARVIYMGELHDHPGHHLAQLQVIRALHEAGVPIAVGLEMMREKSQPAIDQWVAGDLPERKFRSIFEQNWGMWEQYAEILRYARQEKIPLVGLNIPREITRQVAREGYESLSPEQLREAPGVSCSVDVRYRDFIRRSLGGHGHGHGSGDAAFENFCEAQMVWDTAMAHNLLQYLQRHPERVMIVLAGSGHAWKLGIPTQVGRQRQLPSRVLLPEVRGRIEQGKVTSEEADYLLLGLNEGPLH